MSSSTQLNPLARIAADNDPRNGTIAQRICRSPEMRPDADGLYRHEPKDGTKHGGGSMATCVHCDEPIGFASENGDEASWRYLAMPARLLDAGWRDKAICPGTKSEPSDAS